MLSPRDFLEQALHLGIGLQLVFRRHRDMVEGNAVPLDEAAQAVVVRDHAGNLDVEFLRLPAGQQVVEAVFLLADQDHDALLDR
jgi:hypothetical protein